MIIEKKYYLIFLVFILSASLSGCSFSGEFIEKGKTDEQAVWIRNYKKNNYSISMVKDNSVLKTVELDSHFSSNFPSSVLASLDLNQDSIVYFLDNLGSLNRSRIVIYYELEKSVGLEPEKSFIVNLVKFRTDSPDKIVVNSGNLETPYLEIKIK